MSDTAQLFIVAGVWAATALFIARLFSGWPPRVVVYALLVGIPFWELPYGYYNFQRLCENETKVRLQEGVEPQSAICVDDLHVETYRLLTQIGFGRIEVKGGTNLSPNDLNSQTVVHVERGKETSKYCFTTKTNLRLPARIWRTDKLIVASDTQRIVAQQSNFNWVGMWWQEEASPMLGRGGECGEPLKDLFIAVQKGGV